jgi:hypothetical protein
MWRPRRCKEHLGVKRLGVKLTTHLHLMPRSRMRGAIPPLPQYAFMAWWSVKSTGTTTLCVTRKNSKHGFCCMKLILYFYTFILYYGLGGWIYSRHWCFLLISSLCMNYWPEKWEQNYIILQLLIYAKNTYLRHLFGAVLVLKRISHRKLNGLRSEVFLPSTFSIVFIDSSHDYKQHL